MIRRAHLLLLVSFVLVPARVNADDTYTIKIKESAKGDTIQTNKESTEKTTFKLEDSQGNILQEKNEDGYREVHLPGDPSGKTGHTNQVYPVAAGL